MYVIGPSPIIIVNMSGETAVVNATPFCTRCYEMRARANCEERYACVYEEELHARAMSQPPCTAKHVVTTVM